MDVISKPISSYIVQRRVNSVIELFTARKDSPVRWARKGSAFETGQKNPEAEHG